MGFLTHLFLFVCYSCCLPNLYAISTTFSIETDKEALISIKSQIITQPPQALATWDPASPSPCNWTRVLCDDRSGRVVGLNLSRLHITGQISPYIGNLSSLTALDLQNNQFEGILPETITNLLNLQVLNVSFNRIRGTIPQNISQCVKLRVVDLMRNKLTGSIPEGITVLFNIQTLNLARNQLLGFIPPSIGNLSSLHTLRLCTNTLSGPIPSDLSRLRNLKILDLTINNLTGTIHPSFYNMSLLEVFAVASNGLWGDIPYNVGDTLPNLLDFNFCINGFTGSIPGSLHNLTSIRMIRMQHNQLHGNIPPGLGNLRELKMYNIGYNNIVSAPSEGLGFLNGLVNSTKLDSLVIEGNRFDGVIPHSLGNLSKQLRTLLMGSNRISGSIPSSIGQLKGLTLLDLSYNSISGKIPFELGQLEDLQELVLGKNRFNSNIPSSLGNLRKLAQIDLSRNELGGNIPISFTNFKRLISMDLSMNKLNGSIPREVLDLPSLATILNLSNNLLSGFLPREIQSLERVGTLDLSNNYLSGNIPNSIKNCKSLEHLIISKNSFSGNIPSSLGELKGLETLDLSSNQFSGPIPLELQHLHALIFLNISFNNLEGKVPSNGIFSSRTRVHLEGNPMLCKDSKCTRGDTYKATVISVVVIFLILVILMSIALFFYFRKNNVMIMESLDSFKGQHEMVTYDQLRYATGNFNEENLIGYGGYGSVYKGCLNLKGRSQDIAVKVLDMETTGSLSSFFAECTALRHLKHRNLVKLITSCSSLDSKNKEFIALVYEYMKNHSLQGWIGKELGFLERLKVAIDVACGLTYMHHDCVVAPVVHCDLKPSNVLLDEEFTAKIGDFGLASMLLEKDQYVRCNDIFHGSMGYIPPEYGMGASPSTKGDVYNYGIMLMEIFTGKRPTSERFVGGLTLKTWVQSAFPANLNLVLDPNLIQESEEFYSQDLCSKEWCLDGFSMNQKMQHDCIIIIFEVALSCTNDSPERRIIITEALRKLKHVQDMFLKSSL